MTDSIRDSADQLYPQLLGSSWDDLDEAMRRFHGDGKLVRASGIFRVRHGDNRLARWLVRLAGLPAQAEAVEVRLVVIRGDNGEEWSRTFAGRPLVSYQWNSPGGLLVERMGLLEIRFRLVVDGGALIYHPQGASLCLGLLRIPFPKWCMPQVFASEKPVDDRKYIQVSVETRLSILGLLVAYEGTLTEVEVEEREMALEHSSIPGERKPALIARRRFHRWVFLAAALYNVGWGLFAALDPQWLFRFAKMPEQNYPEIFACLGMVVGLYGILYLEVARVPERGWLLAAVGLLGKVLGPVGWLYLVWRGRWPIDTLVLCLTNDLIWWIPFGLYLYDAWPAYQNSERESSAGN